MPTSSTTGARGQQRQDSVRPASESSLPPTIYGTVRIASQEDIFSETDTGRATSSRSRSRSATALEIDRSPSTLELAPNSSDSLHDGQQHISLNCGLIMPLEKQLKDSYDQFNRNLYESVTNEQQAIEQEASSKKTNGAGLKNNFLKRQRQQAEGLDGHVCDHNNSEYRRLHHLQQQQRQQSAGKFRFVIATLIVLSVTLVSYASNTMYIAAIEMISNDVLQSGLTSLRAKHISNDPLVTDRNAALPGTCPVQADDNNSERAHNSELLAAALLAHEGLNIKLPNASEISAHERLAMQKDSDALYKDINQRLASGQLVDWSIQQRGYVFTAHTIGTILLAVPISRLGLKYGSKVMIFICILSAAVRMGTLPTVAGHAPFWATFVLELVIGGIGGNVVILGYPIAAAWLLPSEANFFVAINIIGQLIGNAATNFFSTQLLAYGLDWCWCYYVPGICLAVLCVGWFIWGSDRPESSRFVSRAELELLQSNTIAKRNENLLRDFEQQRRNSNNNNDDVENDANTNGRGCNNDDDDDETQPLKGKRNQPHNNRVHQCQCSYQERLDCPSNQIVRKPNWTVIFTCPTIWALILVQFANHWTTKNATLWPTFFTNILHIDSSTIGFMIGIKGIWALIFCSIFAVATKALVINRPFGMSLTAYRRWNQAIATTIYAISTSLMVLKDCDILANFIALLIQPLATSFNSISHDQMPLDLSAEDSGLLVSVIRLLSIGDIVALPVSSYILSHANDALAGDRTTWQLVWLFGMAVRLSASLYFVLVAKSRPKSYSRMESQGPCKKNSIR